MAQPPEELWQVTTSYLCAAFVVQDGEIVSCAPILRSKLSYWRTIARRVYPPSETCLESCLADLANSS